MKRLLFVFLCFPIFASAGTIECSGFTMKQGKMTKPLLKMLAQTTSNANVQRLNIYEINEKNEQKLLATGTVLGRLQSSEKSKVNLTYANHTKYRGDMTRGNDAWKGSLALSDASGNGALFNGCGEL
jgi:hypothetical protein